jgi:hypothetical protein
MSTSAVILSASSAAAAAPSRARWRGLRSGLFPAIVIFFRQACVRPVPLPRARPFAIMVVRRTSGAFCAAAGRDTVMLSTW